VGTNRNRVCYFLSVINSNLGPILHRFEDTEVVESRHLQTSLGVTPFEFRDEPEPCELSGEVIVTLALFVLIESQSVTDRRTDILVV